MDIDSWVNLNDQDTRNCVELLRARSRGERIARRKGDA